MKVTTIFQSQNVLPPARQKVMWWKKIGNVVKGSVAEEQDVSACCRGELQALLNRLLPNNSLL